MKGYSKWLFVCASFAVGVSTGVMVSPAYSGNESFAGHAKDFDPAIAPFAAMAVLGNPGSSIGVRKTLFRTCSINQNEGRKCEKQRFNFALIDAENGSPEGMVAVAGLLSRSSYCFDLLRAQFWILKAEDLNYSVVDRKKALAEKIKNCH